VVNLAEPLAFQLELRKLLGSSLECDLLSILSSLSPIVSVLADDSGVVEVLHKETLRAFLSQRFANAKETGLDVRRGHIVRQWSIPFDASKKSSVF